jgi:hypothetical protein
MHIKWDASPAENLHLRDARQTPSIDWMCPLAPRMAVLETESSKPYVNDIWR